jgi:hypothetical protein
MKGANDDAKTRRVSQGRTSLSAPEKFAFIGFLACTERKSFQGSSFLFTYFRDLCFLPMPENLLTFSTLIYLRDATPG